MTDLLIGWWNWLSEKFQFVVERDYETNCFPFLGTPSSHTEPPQLLAGNNLWTSILVVEVIVTRAWAFSISRL